MTDRAQPRLSIFGAPLGSGNLGLSALGIALLSELAKRLEAPEVSLFDHERGVRRTDVVVGESRIPVQLRGAQITRRLYRGESLWTMDLASRWFPAANANIRAIDRSAAVLDISGGDSFADLYGSKQFAAVALPKRIALRRGVPLVLLPQTYGPFTHSRSARFAADVVRRAAQAWARDLVSFERLRELVGAEYDPQRHRCGVDVAFALPSRDPGAKLGRVQSWLEGDDPVVGVNVSGLLYNKSAQAQERFGLRDDHRRVVERLVRRLLQEPDIRVVLVPHVVGPGDESDDLAGAHLAERLGESTRVLSLGRDLDASEVKYLIDRLDWFVGARMHSTIAALSSRTPAAAMAYSDKFRGVFASCDVGHRVLDARGLETHDLVDAAMAAFDERDDDVRRLGAALPQVEAALDEQFDAFVRDMRSGRSDVPRSNAERTGRDLGRGAGTP
jgi:colanic acid/amylovoran biosynthesis protein